MEKFNQEHYQDPTPQRALSAVEAQRKALRAYRPLVYICSPYSGATDKNILAARRYCRFAFEEGYLPLAPHLLFPQFLDDRDPKEREAGLHFGNILQEESLRIANESLAAYEKENNRTQKRLKAQRDLAYGIGTVLLAALARKLHKSV